MILLTLVAIALGISLLCGGTLRSLANIRLKHSYLVLVALAIQIVVFSSWWAQLPVQAFWKPLAYAISLFLLLLTIWLNRHLPGILVLGIGLLLNTVVILANGGHMPATLRALQGAGIASSQAEFEAGRTANSSVMGAATPLWFLGDIFYLPHPLPLANVFSIGDVFIVLGAIWFVAASTRPSPDRPTDHPPSDSHSPLDS